MIDAHYGEGWKKEVSDQNRYEEQVWSASKVMNKKPQHGQKIRCNSIRKDHEDEMRRDE